MSSLEAVEVTVTKQGRKSYSTVNFSTRDGTVGNEVISVDDVPSGNYLAPKDCDDASTAEVSMDSIESDLIERSRCRFMVIHQHAVLCMNRWLKQRVFVPLMLHVGKHPSVYVVVTLLVSIAVPLAAVLTGSFEVLSNQESFISHNDYPKVQERWIEATFSEFRPVSVLLHANGENMVTVEGVERAWHVIETISTVNGFDEICGGEGKECLLSSLTNFWDNEQAFQKELIERGYEGVLDTMSGTTYADGSPVDKSIIYGKMDANDSSLVTTAASFRIIVFLPESKTGTPAFESRLISALLELNDQWHDNEYELEAFCTACVDNEVARSIDEDMPLFGVTFAVMLLFAAAIMTRCQKNSKGQWLVSSHGLLGIGATTCVLLSIGTGFGFCALCGIQLTSATTALPFILIGIGLDDAFVLIGAFRQTQPDCALSERLRGMAEVAGPSILVTTLTDMAAFGIGGLVTSIPTLRYVGFYAVVSVFVDFVYQVTFFIALIVLDQRRQAAERRDFFFCSKALNREDDCDDADTMPKDHRRSKIDFVVNKYATFLLHPLSKTTVVVGFTYLLVVGIVGATQLTVEFAVTELTPSDSYIDSFFNADREHYSETGGGTPGTLLFSDLDLSKSDVVDAVYQFVDELHGMGFISRHPSRFWIDDFLNFTQSVGNSSEPFVEQLEDFLESDVYRKLHGQDIVRDPDSGELIASRAGVTLPFSYDEPTVDLVDFLVNQRQLSLAQPVNQRRVANGSPIPMFLYSPEFVFFEHFRKIPTEMTSALVSSTLTVGVITFFFLPHISGVVLALVIVAAVNVELMGIIYFSGNAISSLTTFILVISIGLVVDYCLHIIHAYLHAPPMVCNNRTDRAAYALKEVGVSVFLGGASNFLGIIFLAFASSQAVNTMGVLFLSVVVLSLAHGLIFAPVALSLIGPTRSFHKTQEQAEKTSQK